ncbi:peptidase; putative AMINOACYL-HISTIDINE DIPEPTIDASE (CARNOSINASE) (XAA-HIS DIPEPTIDASE) PROTEIN; signal [Cupriavidus taiwanensis]|uniref:Peptidase putative AMINOACYL-HISTIDINE DIPEPTIDASE (CARNOSINASE) (XAA-HIS DIPEPTIDASE) PROTEIN signal n=1 Tax=Cupriavidus taiwanensis TaxID=164546 RepID=A0A976AZV8_9BURK|nr:dipeptidase [Cupriavidus taiwanensis]SOZ20133.1 peptidase; putative AMINOACYL-HISTIDINE DIPEPTIDASE (CARNOSINASE) (XAA-HIS DIPEPTIDASE) PROTEIN; signal [Cupriavidus taiwanensis]SOZ33355.1 peptidase; putative AMINOACYL-HISTIDINE DIPEPTIDASE (CARNOSINASE) (XAA-HIS DIPEPTIDASE) PROTEIN; signal [Cupriavidus taiwanensis]SOZ48672.1 peptidase; putative AMINOACYL-HISTIDINE DIPEPTIDASE (CARNOSINASE) (XAA-HIS DIPEPTIDASE) PROTEIN; signal [Cupriavidus taiwanensis]SOZ63242.1 peptidase; putative AMINOACY
MTRSCRLPYRHRWASLLVLSLALAIPAHAQTLKKPALEALTGNSPAVAKAAQADLPAFMAAAAKAEPTVAPAVAAWQSKAPLSGDNLVNVARLLGVYNRLRNEAAAIDVLGRMVALRTVREEKIAQHENPAIIEFGKMIEGMAREFGLAYRNVDNRVFEVSLPGGGKDTFGILTHADVVPAVAEEWVLDDGTRLDPFRMTRIGDLLYGRGTIDDKGSIAAVLYAMKTVKESGVPLERSIRLMIETTEETGGDGMKYYRQHTTLPEYNVVLDSKYPAVVAEKGAGTLTVSFGIKAADDKRAPSQADNKGPAIVAMRGAASANAIPETATARIAGGDPAAVTAALEQARADFVRRYAPRGKFSIDVKRAGNDVEVKVTGASAHGSRPEEGVNPLPRLALFLQASGVSFAENHYLNAVRYLNDLYGLDYLGNRMDVAYRDPFMGPLTMSPTLVRERGEYVDVVTNVRMPRGRTPDELGGKITKRIFGWAATHGPVEIKYDQGNWMARDPKGAWLSTLLNIFGDTTGLEAKPVATAGSTTAKLMPNAINFGPAMPGKKYTAHNAREYKEVADLNLDMQMFTEMLVRIGNLDKMQ